MAEYCGDLMGAPALEACLDFILTGQREDGWLPDRIEPAESLCMLPAPRAPGGGSQLGQHALLCVRCVQLLDAVPGEGQGPCFGKGEILDRPHGPGPRGASPCRRRGWSTMTRQSPTPPTGSQTPSAKPEGCIWNPCCTGEPAASWLFWQKLLPLRRTCRRIFPSGPSM